MAKKDNATAQDVMEAIGQVPDVDERIGRFLAEQGAEFPDASTIEVDFRYQNPFEVPGFLDKENYSYAWLDPQDDIQMYNALEKGFFKIVTRSSSCIIDARKADPYFRSHGAIELQRMILGFRPTDLENRMRQAPIVQHKAMVESLTEPKEKDGYSTSFDKYRGDHNSKGGEMSAVVAYEEAGEEGIISN
jgi:hypothetical protein